MNTFTDPTDALTVPGDLNAIPWSGIEGQRDFSRELGLALCDDDLSFQDTVFLDELPYWCCATQLTSLDFGKSVRK
jgi:hypothetical protein